MKKALIIICAILLSCGLFFINLINSYEKAPTEIQVKTFYESNKQMFEEIKSQMINLNVKSLSIYYEKGKIIASEYVLTNDTLINDLTKYYKTSPIKHSDIFYEKNSDSVSIKFISTCNIGWKSWVEVGMMYHNPGKPSYGFYNTIENDWYYTFVGMT